VSVPLYQAKAGRRILGTVLADRDGLLVQLQADGRDR
jgi:hypothetical protein